jgi:hypothetical protein
VLLLCLLAAQAAYAEPHRWALAVGENRGLNEDAPLRYAQSDARHVLQVLEEVGDVDPNHAMLLAGADAETVRAALKRLTERLDAEGTPDDVVLLYVSAHADDGALHLAGTRLLMGELFEALKVLPVKVAVLIVDSCRSGTLTRMKGLKPVDSPQKVDVVTGLLEGRVVITSSGPDEYSAESDLIQGSFFTHHLLGGLRGPADASGDGEVTLEEAYAWASARTVESTFATKGGVQRPQAHVDLRGYGTLVLTTPAKSTSKLVLAAKEPGQWLISKLEPNGPVALVQKGEGPAEVALPPGSYAVRLRTDDGYRERKVTLTAEQAQRLDGTEMASGELIRVALKGPPPETRLTASIGGALTTPLLQGLPLSAGGEVRLSSTQLIPGQLGVALAVRTSNGAAFSQMEFEARAAWMVRFKPWLLSFAVGPELGGVVVVQRTLPDGTSRNGLEPYLGATLDARIKLVGPMWLALGGGAGVLAVKKDAGTSAVFRGQGFLGLAFDVL